jgi:1-deoxy-D-xylulose 5-phosphate reductoisomerase
VAALSAGSNIDLLEQQIRAFNVPVASVYDPARAEMLKQRLTGFPC